MPEATVQVSAQGKGARDSLRWPRQGEPQQQGGGEGEEEEALPQGDLPDQAGDEEEIGGEHQAPAAPTHCQGGGRASLLGVGEGQQVQEGAARR